MPRRALITGISGQDGSYLAELLLAEGVEVHGVLRSASDATSGRLDAVRDAVALHEGDLLKRGTLRRIVAETAPDEIYHLAAPTFVPASWDVVADSMHGIATVTAELIEAVREEVPAAHTVIATSREIFGPDAQSPQDEDTPCAPSSPYGVAKLAAHQLVGLFRERDGLHLSSAILFNHESPRRDPAFITRKVSIAVAAISLGRQDELVLGNTAAIRDWSAATDIVAALRLMSAAEQPGDYVLASGVGHTVAQLVETAFACVGIEPDGRLRVDESLVRAQERYPVIGDPRRAQERLGWHAQTSFEELVAEMVEADLAAFRRS
ncbi:MAG TPA: GDP-mannose 4,6-dehydratase [Solirubrobacteraceae bacterium]|jgi:GDPmannose 4,6-dehydratase|nr:GDP-mannose 4,6-dehydratase [Solirubrobacteraceae bacterium]